ncbi:hypothetical protein [Microterricola viridarii]|uniref:Uncharacterized protein n=1 Tax=Microterricola viridarii TaxID=412690 RepID=A0A1H1NQR3_9MICO|nr:hypothetical protein [Microterricola viridarii]SDS01354.1 hypothetical protein SAMN04489834_0699 [Microterricola viridarii]
MNSYVTTSNTACRLSSGYVSTDAAAPVAAGYVSLPASAAAPAVGSYVKSELGRASRYVLAS